MAFELTMPKLSDSTADAVILRWLVAPGQGFKRGDALLEAETDKANVVYEAEADGTLDEILVAEGEAAAVGQPIATLAGAPAATNGGPAGERPNATPVARQTALSLGVSLHEISGTGPGARITRDDVMRAAAAGTAPPPPPRAEGRGEVTVLEPTPTQATIARRMVQSATEIPVFVVSVDVDVSQIQALRRGARDDGRDDVPSFNDFVLKAAASALREHPRLNASWVDGRIELYSRVNLGVAVAADDALLVPVLADADRRTLGEIGAETRRLAAAARGRSLSLEELQGATFTVSNLGMYGVRSFTALVDPPQAAILAVGGVRREPVEEGTGAVAFRDVSTLTLSCDHRVAYGADGARFLSRLRELLERPLVLTLR